MSDLDYRDPEWVAEKLGIDKNAVYRFLQDGTLVGLRLGRKWLISERQLAEFLAQEAQRQTAKRRKDSASLSHTIGRLEKDYTPEAREVIERAHAKANELGHGYLGQEHLLLGVAESPECAAAARLAKLGVRPDALTSAILARVAPGDAPLSGRLQRTAPARRAMRFASAEAKQAGRPATGSAELLIGILRAGEGLGWEVLQSLGVTLEALAPQTGEQGRPK